MPRSCGRRGPACRSRSHDDAWAKRPADSLSRWRPSVPDGGLLSTSATGRFVDASPDPTRDRARGHRGRDLLMEFLPRKAAHDASDARIRAGAAAAQQIIAARAALRAQESAQEERTGMQSTEINTAGAAAPAPRPTRPDIAPGYTVAPPGHARTVRLAL